jgi:hypothetical protein
METLESEAYIPVLKWPHMSVRVWQVYGADMVFSYPSACAHWAQLCTRARAQGQLRNQNF